MKRKSQRLKRAVTLYERAAREVSEAGFGWEADWQRSRQAHEFGETDFLREAAWVILCSGFRETAVRRHFDYLSLCFCDWESAQLIMENQSTCRNTAFSCFRNHRKIEAIIDVADKVHSSGFQKIRQFTLEDPISFLQTFPFIGPVTSWHLAKNLGFNVVKNDRHLARLATSHGFDDALGLCQVISDATGEALNVIDIILWRFATFTGVRAPAAA
jgi:hypothetical protein